MKLARVIIFAHDMQRMCDFYHKTLGLPVRNGNPEKAEHWIEFDAGGVGLALHEADMEPKPAAGTSILLSFPSPDVAATKAELEAKGFKVGPVVTTPWVTFCNAKDPEGNCFQVADH